MIQVKAIKAREILDSRGVPTIETLIELSDGTIAKGAVPSGASTGDTEVLELRDGDKSRYFGKGTLKAVETVNTDIAKAVVGKTFESQSAFDNLLIELDGTDLKTKLGGNSILSASMAFCRATAMSRGMELYQYFAEMYWGTFTKEDLLMPQPMILVMEGGAHGNWSTDFQEYMIVPRQDKFTSIRESIRVGAEIFTVLHNLLHEKGYATGVGFEGAYSPNQMESNKEALDLMMEAIDKAGYKANDEILMALDIASSEFYEKETGLYDLHKEGKKLNTDDWLALQEEWFNQYPLWSIEDGMDQEDWDGWIKFMEKFGEYHQVVGDDLLTTNPTRISKGIELGACNSVLIKLNQIGSVTETLEATRMAEAAGWTAVISHRGGETNDDIIADLVVGTYANQSKFGGPDRGERVAKYNRLMEIEDRLSMN